MKERLIFLYLHTLGLLLVFCLTSLVFAQETKQTTTPSMAAVATTQQARFLADRRTAHMRLEVFAQGDKPLYDSDWRAGNLLDWNWQNQQGERLVDGVYRCVVTIKDLTGHLNQQQGILLIQNSQPGWQTPEQAAAAFKRSGVAASLPYFATATSLSDLTAAVLAHNGKEARLMIGSGDLSVHTGNYLQGNEQELMRLSTNGKLEVNGLIYTAEGLVFPDGTVQKTAYVASGQSLRVLSVQAGNGALNKPVKLSPQAPAVGGSGIPNKVLKWAANGVDAEDSQITNLPGAGIRVAGSIFSTFNEVSATGDFVGGYAGFYASGASRAFLLRSANLSGNLWIGHFGGVGVGVSEPASRFASNFNATIGSGYYSTAAPTNGLLVEGNVGIGNAAPSYSLDVSGTINTSASYSFGGVTVLSRTGISNIFVGGWAGFWNTTGSDNTYIGSYAGYGPAGVGSTGYANTFVGNFAGYSISTGSFNTFEGTYAGYATTTGSANTFGGAYAGFVNTTGGQNTFRGQAAGYANTGGNNNTFTGYSAGRSNTIGSNNTFSGYKSGYGNTTGNQNTFSGNYAGESTTTGNNNTFLGTLAGNTNATGSDNTLLGGAATLNAAGLTNATAIGRSARADCSNCLVLGHDLIRVGIGLNLPLERLHVAGNILATGTITPSDLRYKKNVQPLQGALAKVLRLQGVSYDWKHAAYPEMQFSEKNQLGFIAQEVEKVVPEAVQQTSNGMYAMNYQALIPLLVEALKQQQQQVETLNSEKDQGLARLQQQNTALDRQFAALQKRKETIQRVLARSGSKRRRR